MSRQLLICFRKELDECMVEYRRPWKIFSFSIGLALLIVGSYFYPAPDWDVPISIIMAVSTYITASWSLRVFVKRKWKLIPLVLFFIWFTVDGCYWIYWSFVDPLALDLMRDVNFKASLCLYFVSGLVWFHKGTLSELFAFIQVRRLGG